MQLFTISDWLFCFSAPILCVFVYLLVWQATVVNHVPPQINHSHQPIDKWWTCGGSAKIGICAACSLHLSTGPTAIVCVRGFAQKPAAISLSIHSLPHTRTLCMIMKSLPVGPNHEKGSSVCTYMYVCYRVGTLSLNSSILVPYQCYACEVSVSSFPHFSSDCSDSVRNVRQSLLIKL